jgi:hypothetical protein
VHTAPSFRSYTLKSKHCILSNVHFIWWGPCPGDEPAANLARCIGTPVAVANACPQHQIFFWCKASQLFAFAAAFAAHPDKPTMAVRGVDTLSEKFHDVAMLGDNAKWFSDADENLVTLKACNAFSACKDLLSLFILYCEGGFYLDTTTSIANADTLNAALTNGFDGPRMVRIPGGTFHQLGLQTGRAITTGTDGRVDYVSEAPLVDVWALFSAPLNDSLELMYKSYVSRCNRMGLFPGGTTNNFDGIIGIGELDQSPGNLQYRNSLIGNLIIRSVYDGIIGVACNGDETQIENFTWAVTGLPSGPGLPTFSVNELGINKTYAGSWRQPNV